MLFILNRRSDQYYDEPMEVSIKGWAKILPVQNFIAFGTQHRDSTWAPCDSDVTVT